MEWTDYPIKKIGLEDKGYPSSLTKIRKPPKQLFYRGKLSGKIFKKSLAIVGSRHITRYGREMVDRFVSALVNQKITIISGFMYGVDTQAHQKTVDYGGVTIAVFGCGLNVVYPPENEKLYSQILKNGGIVFSEYPPDAKPHLWKFPQRNRIVSGLSGLGVLIVEAAEKSGALVTAKIAGEQKKKIFAVPGPITSSVSAGTNLLIKEAKAKLVTSADDILGKISKSQETKMPEGLDPLENKIWKILEIEPLNTDEVAVQIGKSVVEVGKALSMMSLKGLVSESSGKFYIVKA